MRTDVLCLGETMAMFVPAEPGPPAEVTTWHRTVGGAESNVACHVAALGLRSSWVSADSSRTVTGGRNPSRKRFTPRARASRMDNPDSADGIPLKRQSMRSSRSASSAAGSIRPGVICGKPLTSYCVFCNGYCAMCHGIV